jgi:catechol 2,3-dioxygenase-like lactoylglutathione lyase family enzyme
MLHGSSVTTMLPAKDMSRAREFYEDRLGLECKGERPDGRLDFEAGHGVTLELFPRPEGTAPEYTAVSIEVDDLEGNIRELERTGVVFEDYDMPELTTIDHIATMGTEKAAWFKDTEGNFLCLHQDTMPLT